jgi:hypothetical protein
VVAYADRVTVTESGYVTHGTPPRGSGERWHKGFNPKQRSRIMRAADFIVNAPAAFVTLTFPSATRETNLLPAGSNVIDDAEARDRMRAWLRSCGIERYLWVAEVQPGRWKRRGERAVHFHLLISHDSAKGCPLQWREKWNALNGGFSILDVVECYGTPGAYLTKYVAKAAHLHPVHWIQGNGYGMDHETAAMLKPIAALTIDGACKEELSGMMEQAAYEADLRGRVYAGPYSSVFVYENCEPSRAERCQIIWYMGSNFVNSGIQVITE